MAVGNLFDIKLCRIMGRFGVWPKIEITVALSERRRRRRVGRRWLKLRQLGRRLRRRVHSSRERACRNTITFVVGLTIITMTPQDTKTAIPRQYL